MIETHIFLNGEYACHVNLAAPPFIGAAISAQRQTPEGTIVRDQFRVLDVTFVSYIDGRAFVKAYCTRNDR